jgi:hypothetical protein
MAAETVVPRRLCGAMPANIRELELNPALRSAQFALETELST